MSDNMEMTQMDCSRFEEALDDLDRPGTRGLALREAALVHAEGCSRCAQMMNDAEALDFALQSLALRDADLQAPPRVEAALLQQIRQQKNRTLLIRTPWRVALLGTAAMALLALGLSVRHASNIPGGVTSVGQPSASNGAGARSATALQGATNEVAENVSTDSQAGTEFVSLPYAADPATLDGGTVVRVELSRSALASMGMPVADAGATDRIPADIILSEDGAPQAIRLVGSANSDR